MQNADKLPEQEFTQIPGGFADGSLQTPLGSSLGLFAFSEEPSSLRISPSFPDTVPCPKYQLGDRCRWIPNPNTDWGTVIGQVYAPGTINNLSQPAWLWLYLLLLDTDSPSRKWIMTDWVEENDLELLPTTQSSYST